MATFLQRIGRVPMSKLLQTESLDDELRAGLWNAITLSFWSKSRDFPDEYTTAGQTALDLEAAIRRLWIGHLKRPLDTLPPRPMAGDHRSVYGILRQIVMEGRWDAALDIVDALVSYSPRRWQSEMAAALNSVLEQENAAYRFVNAELTPITSPVEIAAIESAIEKSSRAVRTHLEAALGKLSDRKHPDYRNSIKESISAVEAACQAVAKQPSASLNDCLKVIKKSKPLHPAFESALTKLYGYTSDASGIRHAMAEEGSEVTHADAQFMLVSCSAFTNYLWTVAAEAGIEV
ncbi:AbiJ-NTD4 domain-containing protein [Variovorax arabinosiphilus]|uniref:AbiJ-NTD4 domain-containing protein n=1 Tax=Variovorax arabinosiphilus TaxID=3053498 RepID=UPI002576879A|nr:MULTISPECIES: hypothetical protein [unclassified Variovorax]MDM0118923.1 hypothetical protein [Variovorax sp. J2L1-78]MDM0129349.1 hypothetical protein [Variovorax sp. J2L1-63]MDM0232865.1 hypothetical protein [Variovorax sp. J2R1-6]